MELFAKLDYEVLEFPTTRGHNQRPPKNNNVTVMRNTRAKTPSYRCYFSRDISDVIKKKQLTHFLFHRERYSGGIYIVFFRGNDNISGRIWNNSNGYSRITNKGLIKWLGEQLRMAGDFTAHIPISNDLEESADSAVFKLEIDKAKIINFNNN